MASPSWEKQVPGAAGGRLQGFSMGGGEIARYFGKYGSNAASKAVVVRGGPHCITWTHAEEVTSALLSFFGEQRQSKVA